VTGQRIVRADSLVETVLGLVLVVGALAGVLDAGDFPPPVGTPLIVVVGVALVALGAILVRIARRPVPARLLRTLAAGNVATAALALVWLLAASGFSTAGATLVVATIVALACLAAVQLALADRGEAPEVAALR